MLFRSRGRRGRPSLRPCGLEQRAFLEPLLQGPVSYTHLRLEHTGVAATAELNQLLAAKGEPPAKNSLRLSDLVRRPRCV